MTERDDELARALGDLPVPEHEPDFWDRLERRLDDRTWVEGATAAGSGGPPDRGDAGRSGGGATVDGDRPGDDDHVVPLRRERRTAAGAGGAGARHRGRWAALAAAAVVVVGAAGGVLATRGDDDGDVVTVAGDGTTSSAPAAGDEPGDSTTVAPSPGEDGAGAGAPADPTPSAAGDPATLGTVEAVGLGLPVAALPATDGTTTVLVRGLLPGDEVGCEGAPLEGLLVLEADGSTRPVTSADGTTIVNGVDVHVSPDGDRVAVVSQCEGFLGQLLIGDVGPDGVPTDLQVVAGSQADGSPVPGAPDAEGAPSVTWTADGTRVLLTTAGFASAGATDRALWSYDVTDGSWTERTDGPQDVVAAVERRDGTLVAVTEDALVVGDEDGSQPRRGVNGLALAPDGMTVIAHGAQGILLVDETGGVGFLTDGVIGSVGFLPDGSWLAFSRFDEVAGENEVATLPLTSGQPAPSVLGTSSWGWFEVLPDGSGLLVAVDGEADADGFASPAVERWSFAAE